MADLLRHLPVVLARHVAIHQDPREATQREPEDRHSQQTVESREHHVIFARLAKISALFQAQIGSNKLFWLVLKGFSRLVGILDLSIGL